MWSIHDFPSHTPNEFNQKANELENCGAFNIQEC